MSIGSSATRGDSSIPSPSRSRNASRTASDDSPGTVRTSMPASARSGTELMLMPPENVPSETVGAPSSGCSGRRRRGPAARGRPARAGRWRSRPGAASSRARSSRAPPRPPTRRPCARRTGSSSSARPPAPRRTRPARPSSRASASAPSQPVSSPAHSTSSSPAEPTGPRATPLRRDDDRRRPALHVARAAPEQAVAVGLAGERVDRPVRAPERHGVEVARSGTATGRHRRAGRRATSGPERTRARRPRTRPPPAAPPAATRPSPRHPAG